MEEIVRTDGDPCQHCHRWSECNGVDKEHCPLTKKEGQANE